MKILFIITKKKIGGRGGTSNCDSSKVKKVETIESWIKVDNYAHIYPMNFYFLTSIPNSHRKIWNGKIFKIDDVKFCVKNA